MGGLLRRAAPLVLAALLLAPPASALPLTLQVALLYDNGSVSLQNATALPGLPPAAPDVGDYRLDILSETGSVLYHRNFSFPAGSAALPAKGWFNPSGGQVYTPAPGEAPGPVPSPPARANATLRVPWFGNGVALEVLNASGRLLRAGLAPWLCRGGGACGLGESSLLCPSDCPRGGRDSYCEPAADGVCDPDCAPGEDPDCRGAAVPYAPRSAYSSARPGLGPAYASGPPGVAPPLSTPRQPGFGAPLAVGALALVALSLRRRR